MDRPTQEELCDRSSSRHVPDQEPVGVLENKIKLESLTVLPDRLEARVRIVDPHYRMTTPQLARVIVQQFPTLPYHACRNDHGTTFGAVINNTSVPHLLEHLVIDIQTHEHAKNSSCNNSEKDAVFTGTTQWSAADANVAIVRVSFLDDLIALAAFKKALHAVEHALSNV